MLQNRIEQVGPRLLAGNRVRLTRIQQKLRWNIISYKLLNHLDLFLHVDIIVARTLRDQQISM